MSGVKGLFEIRDYFFFVGLLSWEGEKYLIVQILNSEQLTLLHIPPAWVQKQKQIVKVFKVQTVFKVILPGEEASRVESAGKRAVEVMLLGFR